MSKFRKSSTEVKAEMNGKKAEVKQDRRKTNDTKNSRFWKEILGKVKIK